MVASKYTSPSIKFQGSSFNSVIPTCTPIIIMSVILMYSETCVNGHLYSETTCTKRPLCDVPKVSAPYILPCIQRPPLYKGHYEGALAWPLNTGFTVMHLTHEHIDLTHNLAQSHSWQRDPLERYGLILLICNED